MRSAWYGVVWYGRCSSASRREAFEPPNVRLNVAPAWHRITSHGSRLANHPPPFSGAGARQGCAPSVLAVLRGLKRPGSFLALRRGLSVALYRRARLHSLPGCAVAPLLRCCGFFACSCGGLLQHAAPCGRGRGSCLQLSVGSSTAQHTARPPGTETAPRRLGPWIQVDRSGCRAAYP